MKKFATLFPMLFLLVFATAQDYIIQTVGATAFDPNELTIFVGETVEWQNTGGFHNVNGTQAAYPDNPESFGNDVGSGWTFQFTFNMPGIYNYHCDPHQNNGMTGTITVLEAGGGASALIIAGLADPQPNVNGSGAASGAKTLELYAIEDINDLSIYGIGVANNGGGSDGEEFTFPAVAVPAGSCIMLTDSNNLSNFQTFFGFDPDFLVPSGASAAVGFNGDDALELYMNGQVVDVFGDINTDGSGTSWEYTDGWVYRVNATGPDGSTFVEANWTYSGVDALQDDVFTMNEQFAAPFPNCSYSTLGTSDIIANNDAVNLPIDVASDIDILANDMYPNGITTLTVNTPPTGGTAQANGTTNITYTPNPAFCGSDQFTYEICDQFSCAQAVVSITIDCPTVYPEYPIGLVTADADGNGLGDSLQVNCSLTGVVYGVDLRGGDGLSFTIIGSDNEGINVFNFNEVDGYQVQEGDEITVQGEIIDFNGLTEILAETILMNSSGNTLIDPTDVTSLGEDTESQLVRMTGMTFVDAAQWLGDGSSFNVEITDGTNTFVMRIDNDVDAADMPVPNVPAGSTMNIIGIGGQYDQDEPFTEGYQLLPRYMADITVVTDVATKERSLLDHISLFPNPADDYLYIASDIVPDEIRLSNALGQILQRIPAAHENRIDITKLPAGLYSLTFIKGDALATATFVKK